LSLELRWNNAVKFAGTGLASTNGYSPQQRANFTIQIRG